MEMIDGMEAPQGVGVTNVEDIARISGLDYMRGIVAGQFPVPPIGRVLQFRMIEADEGTVTFTGVPSADYLNPIGSVHGGYAATLLDSALACAVQTLCPVGYASTSIDLKINFVRAIRPDTGRLFARAEVVHPGRQIATAEGRLVDENGKLFAHGSQACSVFKITGG